MRILLITVMLSMTMFANFKGYIPQTTIPNYDMNITVEPSGSLKIIERIEVIPRKLYKDMGVDNPLLNLEIPTMIKSKHAIRYIDSEPYDFSVSLNGKPVSWEEKTFFKNAPDQMIRLRLSPNYIMDLLTDDEIKSLENKPKKYVYTIEYKIKKSVIEADKKGFDTIKLGVFKTYSYLAIKHAKINIFFPSTLSKHNIDLDIHYIGTSQERQTYIWKNSQHYYAEINNLSLNNNLSLRLTFPQGALQQTAADNFDLVLGTSAKGKTTSTYRWDTFLLYWPIPFFIVYFILLYYYARSYGSLGALGSIAVQYKPADNMSLLQSGLLLDKSADYSDIPAAIVELAGLGYLEIVDDGWGKTTYLKQIKKGTSPLSEDQRYLLERVLFPDSDVYYLHENKSNLYRKIEVLNANLHDWMLENGYIHENFKKTRKVFLLISLITSIPILVFSLYVTKDLYGERMMLGSIAGTYFLSYFIAMLFVRQGIFKSLFSLLVIYIIIGASPLRFLLNQFIGSVHLTFFSNPFIILPLIYASIFFFYKKIGIYTGKGLKAYKHLLGYKEFIGRAEVSKLEYELKENPKHIEPTLPYAILFGMISYSSLSKLVKNIEKDQEYVQSQPLVIEGGFSSIINALFKDEMFVFWLVGMILFLSLIAYSNYGTG